MTKDITHLIALARSVIHHAAERSQKLSGEIGEQEGEPGPVSIDVMVDEVEGYAEEFSIWFEANKESFTAEAESLQPMMKELLKLHKQVLHIGEQLILDTSDERKALRKRGKGIMAYIDVLPRRVSVTGKRKG